MGRHADKTMRDKFVEAELIFESSGFYRRVLPLLILVALLLFAGATILTLGQLTILSVAAPMLGVFMSALTYAYAAGKHQEFKARYGEKYAELVRTGRIPLNASAVLSVASPAPYGHLFEPNDQGGKS
jgi:hypothetical protein